MELLAIEIDEFNAHRSEVNIIEVVGDWMWRQYRKEAAGIVLDGKGNITWFAPALNSWRLWGDAAHRFYGQLGGVGTDGPPLTDFKIGQPMPGKTCLT